MNATGLIWTIRFRHRQDSPADDEPGSPVSSSPPSTGECAPRPAGLPPGGDAAEREPAVRPQACRDANSTMVTSDGAPTRTGGPQAPAPRLTYSWVSP